MIHVITSDNAHLYPIALDSMYRDRKAVFVDHLHWDVPVVDGIYEKDQFDNEEAVYLVVLSDDGTHLGSMRLIPTTKPHILGDLFPFLCDGEVPRAEDVLEATRLIMSPKVRDQGLYRSVKGRLGLGMTEYALLNSIKAYTACAHASWLGALSSVGWRVTPLGSLRKVDEGELCGAIRIDIDEHTLELLRGLNQRTDPVLVWQFADKDLTQRRAA